MAAAAATAIASSFSSLHSIRTKSNLTNSDHLLKISSTRTPNLTLISSSVSELTSIYKKWRVLPRLSAAVAQEEAEAAVTEEEVPAPAVEEEEKVGEGSDGSSESEGVNTKLYFGNLPYLCDSAQLAGIVHHKKVNPVLKQPPTSQSVTGILEPTSVEEAMVAPLLARSNLLITRDIEWANLMLGFEQENRYAVMDVCFPQSPVGFIREQSNLLARQFLRTRRPFVAYVTDGLGNELFRVRRPFWWINSSIYAEINGEEVGVVHRRWHLWRRIYDLYLGNKQFAVVENPGFWNWTFTLKDIDGKVLAQIDRDWRGFGFEIFTDAGQYVIRFGNADSSICPVTGIEELDVARPLSLSERAVAVALAISLDNDYFSRHGGWGIPLFVSR